MPCYNGKDYFQLKIVLVCDVGVGKTSLLDKYNEHESPPTHARDYLRDVTIDENDIELRKCFLINSLLSR